MVLKEKYVIYGIEKVENGEGIGLYRPEQVVYWDWEVDEETRKELEQLGASLFNVDYCSPDLFLRTEGLTKGEKERLKRALLWLDEHLPFERTEVEGFAIVPEIFHEPRDIFITPHPDDIVRLKAGKRKRITELPMWQIYFPATEIGK